jgi:hypothetical protein
MVHRKGLITAAACAALSCAGFVQAGPDSTPSNDGNVQPLHLDAAATGPATTEAAPAAAAATLPPLMYGLDKIGVKMPLGITIGGFIDGAYNLNLQNGSFHGGFGSLGGRFQDNFSNRVKLDQADFAIDRSIADISKLDFGVHFEAVFGRDTDFFHSSRIYDNPGVFGDPSGTYYGGLTQPENQFDIVQAYADVSVPVGSGLRIRAGKFVTLLGYESINPTANPFYSHSFEFTYAIPLTQTGVLGHYVFSPDFLLEAGITRGWSQSLRDNNGDPDFLGQLTWTPQSSDYLKNHSFTVKAALSEGPQSSHDNSDWWTVVDLITSIQLTGDGKTDGSLLLAGNMDYGDAPHGTGTSSAQWFGVAAYGSYVINNMFTLNARGEFYNDAQGFTLAGYGSPILAGTPSGTVNLYETTLGVSIKPFPNDPIGSNLVIRPEGRIDYAGKAFFPGSNPHFQASFGMDIYFIY